MTDLTTDDTSFEHHLTGLLRTRAEAIQVTPDLEAVTAGQRRGQAESNRTARTWWVAAAAALALGGIGLSRLAPGPDAAVRTDPAAAGADAPAIPDDAVALLIWLEPAATATEIEEMATILLDSQAVSELRVVGRDGMASPIDDHFVEAPDGVRLIEPTNQPTAFRVITTEPGDVGDLVTGLAALDGVEDAG